MLKFGKEKADCRFKADMRLQKIISGAQTGVDRGALDAALSTGFACGGWCPENRAAEDGMIPAHYPVMVLPGADYRQRTLKNVLDSDGTVIIYFSCIFGGTEQTLDFCIANEKPYLLIAGDKVSIGNAAEYIAEFIRDNAIAILNIAGPRAADAPQAYVYSHATITTFLNDATS